MAAAIIVEDGTGVVNGNSYATLQNVRDYCELRGMPLSLNDSLLIPYMIAAMDYLEAMSFVGRQAFLNGLSWPRYYSNYDYYQSVTPTWYSGTAIPPKLIAAQCQLVLEQCRGITINVSTAGSNGVVNSFPSPLLSNAPVASVNGGFVTRERLEGVSDIAYSDKIGIGLIPYLPAVDALLSDLVTNNTAQMAVTR